MKAKGKPEFRNSKAEKEVWITYSDVSYVACDVYMHGWIYEWRKR